MRPVTILLAAALLAGCSTPSPSDNTRSKEAPAPAATQTSTTQATKTASIRIDNFHFVPADLVVSVGTSVTWTNGDDVPHTVTSRDEPRAFDSTPLDTDQSFSFTFNSPGKFDYFCKVHPHMTGAVIVK